MVDLNACRTTAAGNIITPKCRLSYAQFLLEPNPRAKDKNGNAKYTVSLLIPPNADITLLKNAAGEAAIEKFGEEKVKALRAADKFNSPFLDAWKASRSEKNPEGDKQFEGWTLIRVDSKDRPGFVTATGKTLADPTREDVYSGRWARASLSVSAYPAIDGGKPGVKFYVQNLQLLDHDEPLGGGFARAEDEFEPVEIEDGDTGGGSTDSVFA